LDWVLELRQEVGIPHRLDAIGVSRDITPRLADMAAKDPSCGGNPRALNATILAQLYEDAIDGGLRAA
jgi:alcohol dehydrogenase class IV